MSQEPVLPLDVVHGILQMFQLPKDAQTLGSCSRACKLWLPVARKYLFADLVVVHSAPHNFAHDRRYYQEWNGVLRPVTTDLAFARRLEVISDGHISLLEVLHHVVSSLPLIQHVRLKGGRLSYLPELSDAPLHTSSIDSLEILQVLCSARAFMHLLKVVRPHHLTIEGPYLAFMLDGDREDGDLPPTAYNAETSVRSLRLLLSDFSYPNFVSSMDNFVSLCAPKTVTHLALDLYDDSGFYNAFVQFLRNAKCLEVLEFHRTTRYGQATRFATRSSTICRRIKADLQATLSNLHTLKTLVLGFPEEILAPGAASRIYLYLFFLVIMPVSLQNVELHLSKTSLQLDWKQWDAALMMFPNLRSCKVLVEAKVADEMEGGVAAYMAGVRSALPFSVARGVLSIRIEDW